MRIFVEVDKDLDGELDKEEFNQCYKVIKTRAANQALAAMGLTTGKLIGGIGGITVYLLLAFVFIFMGISAFAGTSSFNAGINSLMPMASGGAAGSGGKNLDEIAKKTEKFITKLFETMKSKLANPD